MLRLSLFLAALLVSVCLQGCDLLRWFRRSKPAPPQETEPPTDEVPPPPSGGDQEGPFLEFPSDPLRFGEQQLAKVEEDTLKELGKAKPWTLEVVEVEPPLGGQSARGMWVLYAILREKPADHGYVCQISLSISEEGIPTLFAAAQLEFEEEKVEPKVEIDIQGEDSLGELARKKRGPPPLRERLRGSRDYGEGEEDEERSEMVRWWTGVDKRSEFDKSQAWRRV